MNWPTIHALTAEYRAGRRSPRDVLEDVYAAIERRGTAPVWISVQRFERSLADLEQARERGDDAPLYGVPFAVKDNIDVAGLPTTAACPAFSYRAERDAFVVERLRAAGAIVIGKTNLDQFATGLVGTRSPYGICSSVFDERYISGGSSSGSAVAVARGDVPFALGTDTAGSGRIPAAFNALVGLKPTPGLFSSRNVVPACRSLDCVSLFTKDLSDAALLFDVCAGFDPEDPYSKRAPALPEATGAPTRIAVPDAKSLEFFGDTESARLFERAVERLGSVADEVVTVDLSLFREAANLLYQGPWVAERLFATESLLARDPEAIEPTVRRILEGARRHQAIDAFRAQYRLATIRQTVDALWAELDALVLPTAPTHYRIDEVLAEPLALNQNLGTYTNFVNLLGLAALAVPAGFRSDALPFGITFVGPSFHDRRLMTYARRFTGSGEGAATRAPAGCVWLAVAGAHLRGQPLNGELVELGARWLRTTRTAPEYRLYALRTSPPKPGLVHAPAEPGHSLEVEIWELDERAFGGFVARIPSPMTIGQTKLEDGSLVKGFTCEPHALTGARDISDFGGWRAFVASERSGIRGLSG